jgi:hypothetical protein
MWGDMTLDTMTDGWFPDGIEILPRPRRALMITVGLVACVFAIAARLLLPRVHRAGTDAISGLVA